MDSTMKNISESNSYHKPPQEQAAVRSSSAVSAIGRRRKCAMGANVSDGKGDACAQARRTERKGPGLILSANVDEEAISEPCNQCVSIRCMSSAALGSAAICGVEYGGVYLDYTWPLNYFEQQHCLLSQEACTLATTPKKVGIGGCKLPAEDDRVLAAFTTGIVSKICGHLPGSWKMACTLESRCH